MVLIHNNFSKYNLPNQSHKNTTPLFSNLESFPTTKFQINQPYYFQARREMWEYLRLALKNTTNLHVLLRQVKYQQLPDKKSAISLHEAIFTSNEQIANLYKTTQNQQLVYPYYFNLGNMSESTEQAMEHFLGQLAEEVFSERIPGFYPAMPETNVNLPKIKPGQKVIDAFRVKFSSEDSDSKTIVSKMSTGEVKQRLESGNLIELKNLMAKIQKTPSEVIHKKALIKSMAYAKLKGDVVLPEKIFKFAGLLVNERQFQHINKNLEKAGNEKLIELARSISKKDKEALIIMKGEVINTIQDCDPGLFLS